MTIITPATGAQAGPPDAAAAGTSWQGRYTGAMMGSLALPQRMLSHGLGCAVWDVDGKRYLDFLAGIAVNSLGHAHPALIEAVTRQIATLAHVSNYFASAPQLALAEKLREITGAGDRGRVYFANSGAEAIEAAVKLARLNSRGGKRRILSLTNSFHGRTMGALSLTGKPALRQDFEPLLPFADHIETTIDSLEAAMGDDVAALVVEPIKGEAGVVDLPPGFLARARELTTRHGALLIVDEIQTGIGRTGKWFGFQHEGVMPDAVAIAKGLAGGVPIGALVTFGDTSELFKPGQHGSTFGGNPLATAAGLAVLTEIEASQLVDNAARRGAQLRDVILSLASPLIAEVRGRGLLIGVGLTEPVAGVIVEAALSAGLIINAPNDSSIRIAPPLIVGDSEIEEFRVLFARALGAVA